MLVNYISTGGYLSELNNKADAPGILPTNYGVTSYPGLGYAFDVDYCFVSQSVSYSNGSKNSAFGANALYNINGNSNTAVGYNAGSNLVYGNNNIISGF